MESEGRKSCLDEDIMKVLSDFSFSKEKLTLLKSEKARLEKLVREKNEEIAKIREAEKVQMSCLDDSKKLISEQQVTISKLMDVKEEIKRYKDIINAREQRILEVEQEKYDVIKQFDEKAEEIKKEYIQQIEILNGELKEMKNELSIVKSEAVCKTIKADEDLMQAKAEKDEQINKLVLDYEEKLQRAHAQYLRMKDEMHSLIEKSNATTAAYKEKIFNLEQKQSQRTNVVKPNSSRPNSELTKMNQNSKYSSTITNQSNPSTYNNPIERPFSRAPTNTLSARVQDSTSLTSNQNHYGSFQLASKQKFVAQKFNNPLPFVSTSAAANIHSSSAVQIPDQENVEEKKKTLKRKLFSKFSEEFAEME